jgi:hypothetical protein
MGSKLRLATAPTLSLWAISATSSFLPLNVNAAEPQRFGLKKTNALKMERLSQEENPESHVGSKMDFG